MIKNGFIVALGTALGRLLQVSCGLIIARKLGVESFGEYGLVLATFAMISQSFGNGLGGMANVLVAKAISAEGDNGPNLISNFSYIGVILGVFGALVLGCLAPIIAKDLFGHEYFCAYILLGLPIILLTLLEGIFQGILSAFGFHRSIAISPVIVGVVALIFIILFSDLIGVKGMISVVVVSQFVGLIYLFCKINRKVILLGGWTRPSYSMIHILFGQCVVPSFLSGITHAPARWVAQAIVVKQESGLVELAGFAAVIQIHGAINSMPQAMRLTARTNFALAGVNAIKVYNSTLLVFLLVLIFPVLTVVVFSAFILSIYGEDFVKFQGSLMIVAIASYAFILNGLRGDLCIAEGRMASVIYANIFSGLLFVFFSWWIGGAMGLSIGLALGYLIPIFVMRIGERDNA